MFIIELHHSSSSPSSPRFLFFFWFVFLFLLLLLFFFLSILFLQTLMNAQHRRPSVAYISNSSIPKWFKLAPTVANTTPAERAVRVVRNQWFVMAQLNLFESKWKINADDNCQNGFQDVTVINLRYLGCHNIRRIINKNIVIWRHAPGHLNDDGNEDVNMMLIRRIRQTLRSVTALQDEWLSVDLKRFWSRVTESHQCFWVCSYFCRRTK